MRFSGLILKQIFTPVIKRYCVYRAYQVIQPIILQSNHYKPERFNFTNITSRQCSNQVHEHCPDSHTSSGAVGKIQPKLYLAFTCKICKTRIEKHISKIAYTKGVVIVRCDGCQENHLIADNLGWFPNLTTMRNIEGIMEAQGETVKRKADDLAIKEE